MIPWKKSLPSFNCSWKCPILSRTSVAWFKALSSSVFPTSVTKTIRYLHKIDVFYILDYLVAMICHSVTKIIRKPSGPLKININLLRNTLKHMQTPKIFFFHLKYHFINSHSFFPPKNYFKYFFNMYGFFPCLFQRQDYIFSGMEGVNTNILK